MAYVHEIKFFVEQGKLFAALYDHPPLFCNEFWIKNIPSEELGIQVLSETVQLEQKYKVEDLGIKPFSTSKPEFEFIDKLAEVAWKTGTRLAIGTFLN